MIDTFWLGLVAKMATSASIVVVASKIVERAGPFLGAMVATLPLSAGPAYVFLAMDYDAAFIERSSLASLVVNAATSVFIFAYVSLARRGLAASLGGAVAAWALVATLLLRFEWSLPAAALANVVGYGSAMLVARRTILANTAVVSAPRRWWDVPLRACAVMSIVVAVVAAGRIFGPRAAGIAALLPVVLTSLALILHPRVGGAAAASVMAHSLPGMLGFTTGLVVLHAAVVPLGAAIALPLALGVCLLWNLGLILLHRARRAAR